MSNYDRVAHLEEQLSRSRSELANIKTAHECALRFVERSGDTILAQKKEVERLVASLAAAQRERKPETTQPDAEEGWAKRIRHAAGEFNNDSKSPMSVIREMASRIRQLEGLVDDLRREANLEETTHE